MADETVAGGWVQLVIDGSVTMEEPALFRCWRAGDDELKIDLIGSVTFKNVPSGYEARVRYRLEGLPALEGRTWVSVPTNGSNVEVGPLRREDWHE